MLLDISGNTFSTLGNTVPTVIYTPPQILGTGIICWVDCTNYRNFYTSVSGSTNVSTSSPITLRLEDISGQNRKFYSYTGLTTLEAQTPPSYSTTSSTVNIFSANTIDTNKGGTQYGTTNLTSPANRSLSRNFIAPNSAATVCSYNWWEGQTNATYQLGFGMQYFLNLSWFGFNNIINTQNISFSIAGVSQFTFNGTPYINKTNMFLGTISGRTYYVYINNKLISSGTITSGITYPISGANAEGGFQIATTQGFAPSSSNSVVFEGFISNSYTSPEQTNLLYNYFNVKYRGRIGRFS
jgi:hypothetical protein